MRQWAWRTAALIGLASTLAGAAWAEPMRISFTGVVTQNNPFVGVPAVGSTFSGSFTFDLATTTGDGPNCTGIPNCWSGPTSAWDFNGVAITVPTSNSLVVPELYAIRIVMTNSAPGLSEDRYDVVLTGLGLTKVGLTLVDTGGTAFEALPQPLVPTLQRFNGSAFAYLPACLTGGGFSCISTPYYYGTITSLVASNNADLRNLALSAGVLLPPFASDTSTYGAGVPSAVSGLTVTPTAADSTATIKVNGATVQSGSPSGIVPLAAGNNPIAVQVTSHDGTATRNYSVNVFRAGGGATAAPMPASVASRKTHGAAGTFDLPLSMNAANPTTEPRVQAGGSHTLVFTFDKSIASATARVAAGTATAGALTVSGASVSVALSNVPDRQYVTVMLDNVASTDGGTGGSGSVRVGLLMGDVTGNRAVSLADLLQVNAVLTQPVTGSDYLRDVNASGTLTISDLLAVGANLAQALPSP